MIALAAIVAAIACVIIAQARARAQQWRDHEDQQQYYKETDR